MKAIIALGNLMETCTLYFMTLAYLLLYTNIQNTV